MNKIIVAILLLTGIIYAQSSTGNRFGKLLPNNFTVATLPVSAPTGTIAIITDGNPGCTAGGGTNFTTCMWNGSAWVSTGVSFPLLATNGNASGPSYSFANGTNTGMYFSAIPQINWAVNGSNIMSLSATIFSISPGISTGSGITAYKGTTTAGIGVVPVYGVIAHTALTANETDTLIASATAGDYRVCANARTTTSGTGTTATMNIIWTDEGGTKTDAVGTFALNSVTVTGQINKCEFIHAAAATAIQCSTSGGTYGTSVYALSCTAEQLQ